MEDDEMSLLRRANLKVWCKKNSFPQERKSQYSQAWSGIGSFGEKAARQAEEDCGMGVDRLLDRQTMTAEQASKIVALGFRDFNPAEFDFLDSWPRDLHANSVPDYRQDLQDAYEMHGLFVGADQESRRLMLSACRRITEQANSLKARSGNDNS